MHSLFHSKVAVPAKRTSDKVLAAIPPERMQSPIPAVSTLKQITEALAKCSKVDECTVVDPSEKYFTDSLVELTKSSAVIAYYKPFSLVLDDTMKFMSRKFTPSFVVTEPAAHGKLTILELLPLKGELLQ